MISSIFAKHVIFIQGDFAYTEQENIILIYLLVCIFKIFTLEKTFIIVKVIDKLFT